MDGLLRSSGLVFAEKPSIGIEPTRLPDRSRFGNHGVHTNVTMVQLPSGLWVRSFNGTSSIVDCGTDASLMPVDQISVALWMSPDDLDNDHFPLAKIKSNGANGYCLYQRASSVLRFAINGAHTAYAVLALQLGWQFIVGTYDRSLGSGNILAYRNCIVGTPVNYTTAIDYSSTDSLYLGRWAGGGSLYDGFLALPKIFNYALTPAQIRAIYSAERHWFGV